MNTKRKAFRALLEGRNLIVAPGAPDALIARIVEEAGFDVCYMGGNGAVASMLGQPDIGLATFSEMSERAKNVAAAISIPLICDADTGYGNVNNVFRTVRAYEQAGVAGIHLEDQVTPKKCGAMDGLQLISLEESAAKIRAAVHARQDPDFVIIARTDARAVSGLEEAVARVQAYERAGADMAYVEMLQSADEVRQVVSSVSIPVVYDVLESSADKALTNEELEELGVRMAIYSMSATLFITNTMRQFMADLKKEGTTRHRIDEMTPLHDYEKLLGIEEQSELQRQFGLIL
jgi:2,3-dimethylmalate lyase